MAHKIIIISLNNSRANVTIVKKELTVLFQANNGAWLAYDEEDRLYSNCLKDVIKALQQDLQSSDSDDRLIASILMLGIKTRKVFDLRELVLNQLP